MFLVISEKSHESTCARTSFLIKLQASGLRPATLLEKRLWHSCFPVNFAKLLRTPFLQNTSGGCFWRKLTVFQEFSDFVLFTRHWVWELTIVNWPFTYKISLLKTLNISFSPSSIFILMFKSLSPFPPLLRRIIGKQALLRITYDVI